MFEDILLKLGYKLIDCGNYWRTQALYRGGKNPASLQIYKNTGVWNDFGSEGKAKPFKSLLELTLKDDRKTLNCLISSLQSDTGVEYSPKTLIQMDKVYDNQILKKLFPNYFFYSKKGISEETQKFFKTGLASEGQLYRRMVFPIYNEHFQIIGFSGRKISEDNNLPKWKHLGKKTNWIYPSYIPADKTVDEIINETRQVYLVESIGDAMALFENGIKNVLVIFGVSTSPQVISYLSGKSLDKIFICLNNDFESEVNTGKISSIKLFVKLSKFFDIDQLLIKLPPDNDFGSAQQKNINFQEWKDKKINKEVQIDHICSFLKKNPKILPENEVKKFLKINDR